MTARLGRFSVSLDHRTKMVLVFAANYFTCRTDQIDHNLDQIDQINHDLDQIDHHLDHSLPAVVRCCSGSVQYRSNPGNISKIMQVIRLPPGSMSYTR